MKNNRNGKAAIITEREYAKIRKEIRSAKYKLLLDLAWFTGERWGALLQLEVSDVFKTDGTPQEFITFKARTRKASPDGRRQTRQIPTNETLKEILSAYKLPEGQKYLFPNQTGDGSLGLRFADKILRVAVDRAGLSAKGISTHSTRRSFITRLWRKGADLLTIKKITGHKSYQVLEGYVEDDPVRISQTINLL